VGAATSSAFTNACRSNASKAGRRRVPAFSFPRTLRRWLWIVLRACGKNVGDLFVALAFNHPMKDLGFSRCQSYSLKILRCRNRVLKARRAPRHSDEPARSQWSARDD